ncbi:MAG: bacteriophage Gp15 family protein [Bacteroidales bacterium]|nr:bacteriophage Gp15 family protein [Clostridium sp.]MCM1204750.1 bacteriophage Gp15 family protein [Bacteroidales bacterium]
MIDLTQKNMQDTIEVGNEIFSIYTDFRIWMRFVIEFENWDKKGELNISYLFKNSIPVFRCREDYSSIFSFAYPINVVPRGEHSNIKVLDYVIDADYIYSAFYQQYGVDLLETDMHWHKFNSLLNGICDGTKLHEIMGYRSYTGEKIKSQDDLYKKLRDRWELPLVQTKEDLEAEEEFNNYFN